MSTNLIGKTAAEMRTMIEAGIVTSAEVVKHLKGKTTLRVPSRKLLDELTGAGTKAAKPAVKSKPATKPAGVPLDKNGNPLHGAALMRHNEKVAHEVSSSGVPSDLAKRIADLESAIALITSVLVPGK